MNKKAFCVFITLGIFIGVSQSFFFLTPIVIFSYFLFIKKILLKENLKDSFYSGWVFGIGFYIGSMHWIVSPFLIYEKHFLLSPISVFFPLLMGLFFSLPCILITIFKNCFFFSTISNITKAFVIASFFFLAEIIKSYIFGGLPLNLTAHLWAYNHEFIQVSKFVGVMGLSFLTLFWISCISIFLIEKKKSYGFLTFIFFPIFLFSFNFFSDLKKLEIAKSQVNFRVIQPNIPQTQKWDKLYFEKNLNKMLELTTEENFIEKEKVVVWPEVALTYFLTEEPDVVGYLKNKIPKNITLITGGLRREFDNKSFKLFNSLYVINDETFDFYDKKKLVPFGEFFPLRGILKSFKLVPGTSDFSEGYKSNQMRIGLEKEEIFFEPSICYEAIFQTFGENKSSVFVNITNDAWFGKTIGPRQHLASQIFRSVEKSVFFLRSANSGISVAVNDKGEILKKIKLNSTGYIDIQTSLSSKETFFEKHGNLSVFLAILFLGLLFYLIEFLISLKRYN
jgi:apolipoprotein N-acyltransferase